MPAVPVSHVRARPEFRQGRHELGGCTARHFNTGLCSRFSPAAGQLQRLQRSGTWSKSPHPDLATAYAYARIGDSPRDRLDRVKQLAALTPHSIESPIAVASTAIEAKSFDEARRALTPLLGGRLTQRVATLMARIEGEEHGDKGKVREWLARAVNAPRDPAWTADGIVSDTWSPISPVTGALDAFQWRLPVDEMQAAEGEELTTRLESLVALGAPIECAFTQEREEPVAARAAEAKAPSRKPAADAPAARPAAVDVEEIDEVPRTAARAPAAEPPANTVAKPNHRGSQAAAIDAEVEIRSARTKPAEPVGEAAAATRPPANAGTSTAKPAARTEPRPAAKPEPKGKRRTESRDDAGTSAFPLPHAPDDPGPEPEDAPDLSSPYRAN